MEQLLAWYVSSRSVVHIRARPRLSNAQAETKLLKTGAIKAIMCSSLVFLVMSVACSSRIDAFGSSDAGGLGGSSNSPTGANSVDGNGGRPSVETAGCAQWTNAKDWDDHKCRVISGSSTGYDPGSSAGDAGDV